MPRIDVYIVLADLASYTEKAASVHRQTGSEGLELLNKKIREYVDKSVEDVGNEELLFQTFLDIQIANKEGEDITSVSHKPKSSTAISNRGDDAILVFKSAESAHRFAEKLHCHSREENQSRKKHEQDLWYFRAACAFGDISVNEDGSCSIDPASWARAVVTRLCGKAEKGEFLMHDKAFADLPLDLQDCYGEEEEVEGKETDGKSYACRRWKVIEVEDSQSSRQPRSRPVANVRLPENFVERPDEPSEKTVLMLPASSSSINSPRWIAEFKRLETSIKNASSREKEKTDRNQTFEKYKFESKPYITFSELSQELTALEPSIIHITGEVDGIGELLIGDTDQSAENQNELISNLFRLHSRFINCVVLSGCCVEEQLNGIVQYIEFIISIPRELEGDLSIIFLDHFYFQLGFVRNIEKSYEFGMDELKKRIAQRPEFEKSSLPEIFSKEEETKRRQEEAKRRDLEKELEICIKDLKIHTNDLVLWKKKASLLQDLGRINEMGEAYDQIALLEPDYRNRVKQGDALVALEEYQKADSAYDKAVEEEDGEKDYKVWWQKAIACVKAGEYIKAGDAYQKALWLLPPSPDDYVICTEYGEVLSKLKQLRESIQLYSTSLCLQPNYRVASYHRKQLYKKIYSENH
jgi:tetratricopeptide (TPR) repeat protein